MLLLLIFSSLLFHIFSNLKTLIITIPNLLFLKPIDHNMPKPNYKHDMSLHKSTLDNQTLTQFCSKHNITPNHNPIAPQPDHVITDCPNGFIALYTAHFDFANVRLPLSLFIISFLKEYNLNISQLSPNGALKVSHFEVTCRALGYEPSLALFRRFFVLTRYGDWYSVKKRKSPSVSCESWASRNMKFWKDSFFWVSAEYSMPFEMHWRLPHEPLNIVNDLPLVTEDNFDEKLYQLLVSHALPVEGFHEHVLILTGVSRNWPYANAEPILKDGDDEIDLLNYIKKKVAGNTDGVKFTSRFLAENETHILERTKGVCYQGLGGGGGDVETGLVEPVGKNVVGDSSTGGLDNIQGAGNYTVLAVTGNNNEPETVSEGQKRQESASDPNPKKRKVNTDVVVVSSDESQSSSDHHVLEASASTSTRRHEATIEFTESDESSSDNYDAGQTSVDVPQMLTSWYEKWSKREARLVDRIDRYRKNMTELKKSSDKGRDAIRMLGKITYEHAKEVGVLKSELKEARDKHPVHPDESLNMQEKLKRVSCERQWLVEEGFDYVIKRLHKSEEFLKPLGDVESKLYAVAAHTGLVEGYASCEAGVVLEVNELYNPKAGEELKKAVREWENVQYPYVAALSKCSERTLDEVKALEPVGMINEGEKPMGVKDEADHEKEN